MKLFKRNTLNVIFLLPVAMVVANENGGGCASTPEARPGPMTAEQVTTTLSGNTVQAADTDMFAYLEADGALRGANLPHGGTTGRWSVSDNGVLCATWVTPRGETSNCDTLQFVSAEIGYQWGGNSLLVLEGNPQKL